MWRAISSVLISGSKGWRLAVMTFLQSARAPRTEGGMIHRIIGFILGGITIG